MIPKRTTMLDEDHPVGEQLDLAVAGRADVVRVHREERDRDEFRHDVGQLVGREHPEQAS